MPSNFTASERRCTQLQATISQMSADRDQLEMEIEEKQETLNKFIRFYVIDPPIPKDSLLVGPFNNTDLRKIYTNLRIMADTAYDSKERENFSLCLDILSGDSQILARRIVRMREKLDQECIEKQEYIEQLISTTAKSQKAVQKLRSKLESFHKKIQFVSPVLPNARNALKAEVEEIGDTEAVIQKLEEETKNLEKRKESLHLTISDFNSKPFVRPLSEYASEEEIEESKFLKKRKTELDLDLEKSQQRNLRLKSAIKTMKETIIENKQKTKEMKEQSKAIKNTTNEQRWKYEKMTEAKITNNDLVFVGMCAAKTTPNEMEESIQQMKEQIKAMRKKRSELKKKITQMVEQDKQYKEQVVKLEELLKVGTNNGSKQKKNRQIENE
ncbi:hypothetical protein GPJ56_004215 [Histomonas meleagridis]|uniref:uncharacterized protein n=1 Tax=Histomonas meleagridis TaxID=135588 RepID=UPI003559FC2E|nr:hypothetical protein GPJ56_004215 [Histomonas meleagridis]KAH0802236.1 hypothetical protein GO595_004849 [Histomonas meleagridis]